MDIIWILLFLTVLIILYLIFTATTTDIAAISAAIEPFTDIQINTCPLGTNKYYGKTGDILCCSGTVSGNECTSGKTVCSLTSKPVPSAVNETGQQIMTCSQFIQEIAKEKSAALCPKSMPNYFFGGCSSGPIDSTGMAPLSSSALKCVIYQSDNENLSNADSCINQKQLEQVVCPGKDCVTTASPPLISVQYTATDGHKKQCYTRTSYEKYLLLNPTLNDTINIDTDQRICENQ